MNKILLHVEGLAILLLSLYGYFYFGFSWIWFFILLLSPDIFMLGYLINNKVGSMVYNFIHTLSVAILIFLIGIFLSNSIFLAAGLILSSHIGMDRMFGYGLKYPTHFKDTHLNRV
ncbi:DUF4260 domain-containing protein [Gracilibacillus kekensis]|nr:DUF4260 domain-containing protein [Gracilibacillus kekensis]